MLAPRKTILLPPAGGWPKYLKHIYEYIDVDAIIKKTLANDMVKACDRIVLAQYIGFDTIDIPPYKSHLTWEEYRG